MENIVQINRDPFARATLVRRTVRVTRTCLWCGQHGRFEYGWNGDAQPASRTYFQGPFCSVGCYRTYTDQENGR